MNDNQTIQATGTQINGKAGSLCVQRFVRHQRQPKLNMKKQKRKVSKLNGLHLWAVKTQHNHLWITTRRKSAEEAIRKGLAFDRKNNGNGDAEISKVKYRGTLDA